MNSLQRYAQNPSTLRKEIRLVKSSSQKSRDQQLSVILFLNMPIYIGSQQQQASSSIILTGNTYNESKRTIDSTKSLNKKEQSYFGNTQQNNKQNTNRTTAGLLLASPQIFNSDSNYFSSDVSPRFDEINFKYPNEQQNRRSLQISKQSSSNISQASHLNLSKYLLGNNIYDSQMMSFENEDDQIYTPTLNNCQKSINDIASIQMITDEIYYKENNSKIQNSFSKLNKQRGKQISKLGSILSSSDLQLNLAQQNTFLKYQADNELSNHKKVMKSPLSYQNIIQSLANYTKIENKLLEETIILEKQIQDSQEQINDLLSTSTNKDILVQKQHISPQNNNTTQLKIQQQLSLIFNKNSQSYQTQIYKKNSLTNSIFQLDSKETDLSHYTPKAKSDNRLSIKNYSKILEKYKLKQQNQKKDKKDIDSNQIAINQINPYQNFEFEKASQNELNYNTLIYDGQNYNQSHQNKSQQNSQFQQQQKDNNNFNFLQNTHFSQRSKKNRFFENITKLRQFQMELQKEESLNNIEKQQKNNNQSELLQSFLNKNPTDDFVTLSTTRLHQFSESPFVKDKIVNRIQKYREDQLTYQTVTSQIALNQSNLHQKKNNLKDRSLPSFQFYSEKTQIPPFKEDIYHGSSQIQKCSNEAYPSNQLSTDITQKSQSTKSIQKERFQNYFESSCSSQQNLSNQKNNNGNNSSICIMQQMKNNLTKKSKQLNQKQQVTKMKEAQKQQNGTDVAKLSKKQEILNLLSRINSKQLSSPSSAKQIKSNPILEKVSLFTPKDNDIKSLNNISIKKSNKLFFEGGEQQRKQSPIKSKNLEVSISIVNNIPNKDKYNNQSIVNVNSDSKQSYILGINNTLTENLKILLSNQDNKNNLNKSVNQTTRGVNSNSSNVSMKSLLQHIFSKNNQQDKK